MNPILPMNHYIPDVEARQWNDKRIYLYGSKDCGGNDEYCSYEYEIFSSRDMIAWEKHGLAFSSDRFGPYTAGNISPLYAPDCIYKDKKYYLFYCQADNSEGVAVSDNPAGPFGNAKPIIPADGDGIDPAVFIDDDGSIYYYWGQYHAKGGKLSEDFQSIESITDNLLTEEEHGFHEGISIRKRNGLYYLTYSDISRGRPTCLGYAVSENPLGPYEKKNIIIDNKGCDPKSWNNHGCITEINGSWYVFYHRSTHNSFFSRQVCVERITFQEDGTIHEIEMTTQGIEGPISCNREIDAFRACCLSGRVYVDEFCSREEAYEYLTNIHNGDWAAYRYLDFDRDITALTVKASSQTYGGTIEIYLDRMDTEAVGKVKIERTAGKFDFQTFTGPLSGKITGVHALYLKFTGDKGQLMNLKTVQFK